MNQKIKRLGKRAFFYVRQGYSIGSFPVALLGFSSLIYYDLIRNVPILYSFFPHYTTFLIIAGVLLIIYFGLLGYAYMKKLWFFRVATTITVESNPYQTVKITPVAVPMWLVWVQLAKQHGIDTLEVEAIIERSKP